MCFEKRNDPDYWKEENLAKCYLDMLFDLCKVLMKGELMSFFDDNLNLLEGKDKNVLFNLSKAILIRSKKLREGHPGIL